MRQSYKNEGERRGSGARTLARAGLFVHRLASVLMLMFYLVSYGDEDETTCEIVSLSHIVYTVQYCKLIHTST